MRPESELARGDLLLFYTDGVVEVEAGGDKQFGVERLQAVVQQSLDLTASEIIDKLIRATREFSGSENYRDDFTLVIMRRERTAAS